MCERREHPLRVTLHLPLDLAYSGFDAEIVKIFAQIPWRPQLEADIGMRITFSNLLKLCEQGVESVERIP